MGVLTIARLTFREASRRWILWVALALGLLFLVVFSLGFNAMFQDITRERDVITAVTRSEMFNFMAMAGLYAVNFLTLVMAVLTSVDTISGEIASGTIHTLVSKPLRRWEVLLGKWLGFIVMLTLYLALMAGGVLLVVYRIGDYVPPNALRGAALMWMNVALMLSVTLLGGTLLSTLANGVLAFGLYSVAFIGGWIEQVGAFLGNQTAVEIGILASLIIPSEALWRRAVYEMQSPLVSALGVSPFSSGSIPSPLMVAYAAVYFLAVLGLAVRSFGRRDL